jgi:predicted nuclease of predicted toxin-antitoxin system
MKLLIDENLSPKLVVRLADLFPESVHIRDNGLARASDPIVWQYAVEHGLTIISKDEDFHIGHARAIVSSFEMKHRTEIRLAARSVTAVAAAHL